MALFEIAIFASVVLAVFGVVWMLTPRRDLIKDRLEAIRTDHQDVVPYAGSREPEKRGMVARLFRRAPKKEPATTLDARKQAVAEASSVPYLGAKVVLMIVLPTITWLVCRGVGLMGTPYALMAILASAPVGLFAPNVYVSVRDAGRKDRIRRALPDVLDLLVICVEAGMSLNSAFKRVAERIRAAAPDLSDQFLQLHREIAAGRSREDALRALGERSNVDELRSLAAMMIQTDKMGTSISKALRIHAEGIRSKFHHEAEARAARATVKLAFPLVLCIFPALLVVIVGPAAVKIWDSLGRMQ